MKLVEDSIGKTMLKYLSKSIVFQEVPDEISLSLEITNCPHHCKNCHSPELREDIGMELTNDEVVKLIKENPFISCICLMGGDSDHLDIIRLANLIHQYNLKLCLYSGNNEIDNTLIPYLDYYKVGGYKEELGPLNNKNTNQRFYKINQGVLEDITNRFWK